MRFQRGNLYWHIPTIHQRSSLKKKSINYLLHFKSFLFLDYEHYDDLPTLYRIAKLHTNPYRERYVTGSFNWFNKQIVYSYDKYLSAVKEGPKSYFDKGYYVVLLLNFKYLLDHFNSRIFFENFIRLSFFHFTLPFLMKN
jgi:hypothetical protein